METVGSYEAKTHLARLLDDVEQGRSVTITRHGRGVARLVPVEEPAEPPVDVIGELRAARSDVRLDGVAVRDLVEEGRRH